MRKLSGRLILALTAMAGLLSSRVAQADVTLYPTDASGVGGNTSTSAPGFGNSSWQLSGTSKGEVYIPVSVLFGSETVTIDDIKSISYWTNKPGASTSPDWSLTLYTKTTGVGDSSSWYGSRLTAEPYLTTPPVVPADTWHEWSTSSDDPLRFYDWNRNGHVYGTYTDPTLTSLQAGSVTWGNSVSRDYGSEEILFFSLQTGSNWSNGFAGLVDGLRVELNNHHVGTANLEAVPEPSSLALAGLGGIGLVVAAIRRRRRAAV